MTKCVAQKISLEGDRLMLTLNVQGHANYAESGKDIVCSAVSCLCISLANTMLGIGVEKECFRVGNGDFYMSAIVADDRRYAEGVFDTAVNGLLMLSEQYPHHVAFESGVSHQNMQCDTITVKG